MLKCLGWVGVATALAVAVSTSALAQVMVVSARGPSATAYSPGSLLPGNKVIRLVAGDHLTVLEGGGTRQFDGPGSFVLAAPSAQATSALAQLFSQNRPPPSRLGAARGHARGGISTPSNLWQIDVTWPGNFCFVAGRPMSIWRPDADAANAVSVSITRVSDNSKLTVAWRGGDSAVDWPARMPLADGETYLVSDADSSEAGMGVTWRAIDPPTGDWTAFARQLLERRCYAQLDTLRTSLAPTNDP